MIQWVAELSARAVGKKNVYVATEDDNIFNTVSKLGFRAIMTSSKCLTGTDRLAEVAKKVKADIYINVQGDEPLISPKDITSVINYSKNSPGAVINAMCPIKELEDFESSAVPKVVVNMNNDLLYMSRSPIPLTKNKSMVEAFKQVCIYAFPKETLKQFALQDLKTPLESIEDIEILRFLEMGIPVKMIEVSSSSIAVDYPADIKRVENVLNRNSH